MVNKMVKEKSFFCNTTLQIASLFIISLLFIKCSSNKYLPNCNNLVKADSVKYYVAGLIDHTELEKKWFKEEIRKDDVKNWIKNYVDKLTSDDQLDDTSKLIKIRESEYKNYLQEWNKIEGKITDQDKIFYYSTPENYWSSLAGQEGIVIIRECSIMYVLILSQS